MGYGSVRNETSEADQALMVLCFLVVIFIIQRGPIEKVHLFTAYDRDYKFCFPGLC